MSSRCVGDPLRSASHINAQSGPRPRSKGSSRSSMSRDDIGYPHNLYPRAFPRSTSDYRSSLTPAEKAREKRLRDDPMANVIGPLFVDCKRCGARIKLSPKSVYDPFHWKTHKERCLKKPPVLSSQRSPIRRGPYLVNELPSASHTPVSPKLDTTVSTTPPLTPDKDDGPPAHRDSESNDQYFPPLPADAGSRTADHTLREYLTRTHRKSVSIPRRDRKITGRNGTGHNSSRRTSMSMMALAKLGRRLRCLPSALAVFCLVKSR
ncbi:HAMP histidine kinase [Salix suchowensis]|nr:HAMP histidine kinase [Salix suchowensis]